MWQCSLTHVYNANGCVNMTLKYFNFLDRGKVFYLQCQLPEALSVYSDAAALARDQREIEHIILYEQGKD